jgi:hypothetical protein
MFRRLVSIAMLACLSQTAHATEAECIFQMAGKDVVVGACTALEKDPTGSIQIESPDGSIAARIESTGGGVGKAFWNDGMKGKAADKLIGPVVLIGACWSSDKVKLCVTR